MNQVSILLEDLLKLLDPTGRLGSIPLTPLIEAYLESSLAALLKCFASLPSGSFPLAADSVFAVAGKYIHAAVEHVVPCSMLHSLVNEEVSLLDSKSWARAARDGQVGVARDIEATIALLTSEAVLHAILISLTVPPPAAIMSVWIIPSFMKQLTCWAVSATRIAFIGIRPRVNHVGCNPVSSRDVVCVNGQERNMMLPKRNGGDPRSYVSLRWLEAMMVAIICQHQNENNVDDSFLCFSEHITGATVLTEMGTTGSSSHKLALSWCQPVGGGKQGQQRQYLLQLFFLCFVLGALGLIFLKNMPRPVLHCIIS